MKINQTTFDAVKQGFKNILQNNKNQLTLKVETFDDFAAAAAVVDDGLLVDVTQKSLEHTML